MTTATAPFRAAAYDERFAPGCHPSEPGVIARDVWTLIAQLSRLRFTGHESHAGGAQALEDRPRQSRPSGAYSVSNCRAFDAVRCEERPPA